MYTIPRSAPKALTLTEVMLAMAILVIAALGALSYQVHSIRVVRIAQAQTAATHLAQLLLEEWKSTGGSTDYDPSASALGFTALDNLDDPVSGQYYIDLQDVRYYITLDYAPLGDAQTEPDALKQISVTVSWRRDYTSDPMENDDPCLVFTTYVRKDAENG